MEVQLRERGHIERYNEDKSVVGVEGEVDAVGHEHRHRAVLLHQRQDGEVAEHLARHTKRVQHDEQSVPEESEKLWQNTNEAQEVIHVTDNFCETPGK